MRFFTYPTEVLELFVTKAASIKYSSAFSKNHSPDTNDTTDNKMSPWKELEESCSWRCVKRCVTYRYCKYEKAKPRKDYYCDK